jgi:hypothetical protein
MSLLDELPTLRHNFQNWRTQIIKLTAGQEILFRIQKTRFRICHELKSLLFISGIPCRYREKRSRSVFVKVAYGSESQFDTVIRKTPADVEATWFQQHGSLINSQ